MLDGISLRGRIAIIFVLMALIVTTGGVGTLWYATQVDRAFEELVDRELVLFKEAQEMELTLANQKGLLTYYLFDGDGKWLKSLGQYREMFKNSLEQALDLDLSVEQRELLNGIAVGYRSYIAAKDRAIESYQERTVDEGISRLHEKQRDEFFHLLELCRGFSSMQWQVVQQTQAQSDRRSAYLRRLSYVGIVTFLSLSAVFLFIIYRQILVPIRGLALATGGSPSESSRDEVGSLRRSLEDMLRDFGETHDQLAKSRKHLRQAERMAMVGELAAGVAHTIRNPFTSIKMRLFSLSRSLDLSDVQNEDLQVISDEIGRIDKIVQNFLEFSRTPKLRMEPCHLGSLIQSVLKLLEYRLKDYNAEVSFSFDPGLPDVTVDPDRIKEALVNLITNACEAMKDGGRIEIREDHREDADLGQVVVLTVKDYGGGI
ncbi:MAG: MCP four helix bundle domain-containing protein, partial [Desulfofustis sp.]|nr:MCP four helix bundle domain-containing protein [Desulfofustis sp.]